MTKDPSYALVQRIPDGGSNQASVKDGDDAKRQMDEWAAAAKAPATDGAPAEADTHTGRLPADFPGHAALERNGIRTYAQLRKHGDPSDLEGVGPATAAKIEEALGTEKATA